MRQTVVLSLALALVGCFYDEPFLSGRPQDVDTHVLGRWRCVAPEQADTDPAILTVTTVSDHYWAEFTAPGADTMVFSAYAVAVGGKRFLNVQEIVEGKPRKWTIARYTLHTPSILQIELARDEPFRNVRKDRRLRAFENELKGNRLFEDYCACIRLKGSSSSVAPHNSEMQRTKPGQAMELRR